MFGNSCRIFSLSMFETQLKSPHNSVHTNPLLQLEVPNNQSGWRLGPSFVLFFTMVDLYAALAIISNNIVRLFFMII